MQIYRSLSFKVLLAAVLFSSCTSNEIGDSKDVAQDKIYQQYSISYSAGNETANVYAQFRFAGRNGTTLVLVKPSQLSFDGELIKVDSSKYSGAFYQLNKPIAGFYGVHHFVFSDINGKRFDNSFSFDAFKLLNTPVTVPKDQALVLSYETTPLKGDDYIEVSTSGSDSSFSLRHNAADAGNSINIPAKELKRQKGNDLTLEVTLYRTIPLQQNTGEGGALDIRYSLKPIKISLTR